MSYKNGTMLAEPWPKGLYHDQKLFPHRFQKLKKE
jgi:hypothetical protein